MNNSKQESKNELKVISKIEVNTKPKGYDETVARNPAQLGYVHKALDKLIAELNTKFVPELDDVLHNNSNSISQLNDMLTEERSKLDELITKVGNENSGLVQSLNNLQTKVEELENNTINEPDWG
ncbi:hypothetical protein WD_0973 [Wolbachia endosymbiont of Drosophila melanogaster]|uniref:hypothetical protein n=1 Tax=Wolbachia TaxID=953 RepID=UPI000023BBAF|nr:MULTISPECIES: hypothetical protein [Wolbachia]MDE5062848.1 hypothetical protein [Wolbachia endosymbiont of Drosophila chauvacae]CDR79306.1 hypothetical protein WPAU_0940 [Wolbachia endosymbiont of Drosophila simulans wAu]AAS14635.1 hypothetical protein WD_0973 [Wolbachia endosymbiont of Drosophila melanogaster]AOV87678.1 hypothetical protein WG67_04260 [Wolbachia endosymbiont of Drosophila incompta]AOV88331.1 hypothetical protein WH35_04240 [Wolbachia endosymbiont of Drosophila incompta]